MGNKDINCFIIGPIGDENSIVRQRADKLLKHIIGPICKENSVTAIRVDKISNSDVITDTILKNLNSADLVIADLTDHNPNAFYELGYRVAIGKPLIQLIEKGKPLPFDVSVVRTFTYDLTDLDSVEETKKRLDETIKVLLNSLINQEDTITNEKSDSLVNIVLGTLYEIKDAIYELREITKNNIAEIVSSIVKTSFDNAKPQQSMESALISGLLPVLIENPEKLGRVLKLLSQ